MAGLTKIVKAKKDLVEQMDWVEDFSDEQVKAIGVVELVGAIGVIVPVASGILPILSPIAATGLALTMVGAAATHLKRKETILFVPVNALVGGLAAFVAYGGFVG